MKPRIITHANCTDGYSSAFLVKRYFNIFLGTKLSKKQLKNIEVISVNPQDVPDGEIKFTKDDLVVDLPQPKEKVLFWCDHHITSDHDNLPDNYYWKQTPSCASLLINIAISKGLKSSKELSDFKQAIDIMDGALYTHKQIKECFYPKTNYDDPSPLLKLHMVGSMFHTRDFLLNQEIFRTLLDMDLGDSPLSCPELWKLNPEMYHRAQVEGYKQWRENVDTYVRYDKSSKCVLQDDRLAEKSRGVVDRFHVYTKFPQSSYSLNLRVIDEETARFGIGSNIFHKDRCKINIGVLCRALGKKFGSHSGGGHYYVGGVTIDPKNCDKAIEYVLKSMRESKV
jgi:hypothetical protein